MASSKQQRLLFPALLAIMLLALVGFILLSDTKSQLAVAPEADLPVETVGSPFSLKVVETAPTLPTITQTADSQAAALLHKKQRIMTIRSDELKTIGDIDHDKTVTTTVNNSKLVAVSDIVQSDALPDDALFYLHWVTDEDKQGLWGVIQRGLMDRFRQGGVS